MSNHNIYFLWEKKKNIIWISLLIGNDDVLKFFQRQPLYIYLLLRYAMMN